MAEARISLLTRDGLGFMPEKPIILSDVRAGLGSKARAWAQLFEAWASRMLRPSPFSRLGLGLGPGLLKINK